MVGGLEAGRRVAAAALLALGSVVPHDGPLLAAPAQIAPVADAGVACAMTVGTATTDPALANDAARAIAVGYAVTDCMPDAQLLAAAEARALIPMGTPAATSMAIAGSGIVGTSSGIVGTSSGSAAGATPTAGRGDPADHREPATAPATTTSDTTTSDTRGTSDHARVTSETTERRDVVGRRIQHRVQRQRLGQRVAGRRHRQPGRQAGRTSGVTDDGDTGSPTTDSPTTDDGGTRRPSSPTTGSPTTDATATAAEHVRLGHAHGRRGLRRHTRD